MTAKMFGRAVLAAVLLVAALQLVPYGREHHNPAARNEPAWSSAEVRSLAVRACFDCHSHETRWPWYSQIAPVSWLVQNHVNEGRRKLNFSQWDRPQRKADEAAEELADGEMPTAGYTLLHPEALLNLRERQQLMEALKAIAACHPKHAH